MAKNKQTKKPAENALTFLEELDALIIELKDDPEAAELFQRIKDGVDLMAKAPQNEYTYQHPDYKARVRPIARYLKAIKQLDWEFDLSKSAIEKILAKPKKKLAADLDNLIIDILIDYYDGEVDEEFSASSKLIVTLLLLQETCSKENLDTVLELLRQDIHFIDAYLHNTSSDILPLLLYQVGKDQLPRLLEFMKEPGLISINKAIVMRAVSNIAYTTPSRRLEVISWFCQLLNYCYDHLQDEARFDSLLIDSISYVLIEIKGAETLPLLKKIYAEAEVVPLLAGDIDNIGIALSSEKPVSGIGKPKTIYEALNHFDNLYYGKEEEEIEEGEWDEAEEVTPKALVDIPSAKCFTLSITLRNITPKIWRKVQVPSTTTLGRLHFIIQIAMGWKNYHLHQFTKGKECYVSADEIAQSDMFYMNQIDYTLVTLEQLLKRKGSKIQYEYDFGDGWSHEIKLEEQRLYNTNEQPGIALLDGENACPPEDCGGAYGYMDLQEAMKHPRSKAYKEIVDWLGEPFDPKVFDKKEVDKILRSFKC